jgi:hypothetical protein
MNADSQESTPPELSAAAHSEWDRHVEAVLRGIAHALNNRAAALSAVIELAREPDEDSAVSSILGTELERVGDLVATVRSMVSGRGAPQAFDPADAASEAQAILTLHAELRDRRVAIHADGAPPVRLPRWMFLRALVVLGANTARVTPAAKIVLSGDGDWLVARVDSPDAPIAPSACLTELTRAMEGETLESGYGFRVPTLAAIRKREGREG